MSIINPNVTHKDVIPVFESRLFDQNPQSHFAIGKIAVCDVPLPGLKDEYEASWQLRVNAYYHQTGQLGEEDIHADGTDRDVDDVRSVAFGIFENKGDHLSSLNAFLRLIGKGVQSEAGLDDMRPLPVEDFCPEIFGDNPAPAGSVEVSRLIVRHEDPKRQNFLRGTLYATALAYVAKHGLGPTYGVVEPWLVDELKKGVPIKQIGEPRFVEHYKDYNLPIEVDTGMFVQMLNAKKPGMIAGMQAQEGRMMFSGSLPVHSEIIA